MNPSRSPRFGVVLGRALRFGLHWKLLLLWLVTTSLPALLLVLPVWRTFASLLDHSTQAEGWASGFDPLLLAELALEFGERGPAFAVIALLGVILMLLLKPLLDAILIDAVAGTGRLRLGELLQAGARGYWRMLRLLVWSVVILGLAGAISAGVMHLARLHAGQAILAADAKFGTRLALLAAVLVFLLARASLDAAQVGFVLEPARRSVVLAWWRGLRQLLRRPLRLLGGNLLISLISLFSLALLGLARMECTTSDGLGFALGVLLTLALAAIPGWSHAARLRALTEDMATRARR